MGYFDDDLKGSQRLTAEALYRFLKRHLGHDVMAVKPVLDTETNRRGADFWVYRERQSKPLRVDTKLRLPQTVDRNDVLIEIWSKWEYFFSSGKRNLKPAQGYVFEDPSYDPKKNPINIRSIIGWTLDDSKETDYVLYYWMSSKRTVFLPFPPLRAVAHEYGEFWRKKYKEVKGNTPIEGGKYTTLCVAIPTDVLLKALTDTFFNVTDPARVLQLTP